MLCRNKLESSQSNKSLQTQGLNVQPMFQLSFINVVEQLGNSFINTIHVSISYYSLHRLSWNISLLLLYLKSICSICHGKIGKVPMDGAKTHHKQLVQAYMISPTDKWLSRRTLASSLLSLCICSA